MSENEDSSDSATLLCTTCGLCCQGALHRNAVIQPSERERVRGLGLHLLDEDGRPMFALPCPRLENRSCSIYPVRPSPCREYRCGLLNNVLSGAVSLEQAQDRVKTAIALFSEVRADLGTDAKGPDLWRLLDRAEKSGEKEMTPRTRLLVTALVTFLDKHFRNEEEGPYGRYRPLDGPTAEKEQ